MRFQGNAAFRWISFLALTAFTALPAHAAIIRVKTNGSYEGAGDTWATAKINIYQALQVAQPGDQIWVAAGTYVQSSITLKPGVALYGGFAGTETALEQRNWKTNQTIIKSTFGVSASSGLDYTARLDGFTVCDGQGIQVTASASPTIVNNIIRNSAGITCYSASPIIMNNLIAYNTKSGYGGGIDCYGYAAPTIMNNTIVNNSVATVYESGQYRSYGGGIACHFSSSPTISNNVIASNSATHGGGIHTSRDCHPTIVNNTICANTATIGGGGIDCGEYSHPTIANTLVAFNSSGIRIVFADTIVTNCCVYGNTAYQYARGYYSEVFDLTGTLGNISIDPQLANLAGGDFHLRPTSPCIDAGNDGFIAPDTTDFDGQPRIRGTHVDMGAYESRPLAPCDYDYDDDVDATDLAAFCSCITGPAVTVTPSCVMKDLDHDSDVDQSDFGLLQRCLGEPDVAADPHCADQ